MNLAIHPPVNRVNDNTQSQTSQLGDQVFDISLLGGIRCVSGRQIDHDDKALATAVQRQHLELVTRREDADAHHGFAHHAIELLTTHRPFTAGRAAGTCL